MKTIDRIFQVVIQQILLPVINYFYLMETYPFGDLKLSILFPLDQVLVH